MDVDGILALINLTKLIIRGESSQDLKEDCKEKLNPTLKTVASALSLSLPSQYWKPLSIKETPLL